jgi:hypothetical protein
LKAGCPAILDVRTSAHRSGRLGRNSHLFDVLQVSSETRSRQTVKLTPDHRIETLPARYARLIHRNRPNRPHISSDTRNVKERRDKINGMRPNFPARPASSASSLFAALAPGPRPVRPAWRPDVHLSAAGEGVFTDQSQYPQPLFSKNHTFFWKLGIFT